MPIELTPVEIQTQNTANTAFQGFLPICRVLHLVASIGNFRNGDQVAAWCLLAQRT